jgi:hypothetical protein
VDDGHHRALASWLAGRTRLERHEDVLVQSDWPRPRFGRVVDLLARVEAAGRAAAGAARGRPRAVRPALTASQSSAVTLPEISHAVRVRNRLATVRAVEPYGSRDAQGRLHIVEVE